MATRRQETTETSEVTDRNPAEPIGNPPGGGSWTWDIPLQKWVTLTPDTQAATE